MIVLATDKCRLIYSTLIRLTTCEFRTQINTHDRWDADPSSTHTTAVYGHPPIDLVVVRGMRLVETGVGEGVRIPGRSERERRPKIIKEYEEANH